MIKDLGISQSENSQFVMYCQPFESGTKYKFKVDKDLRLLIDDDGYRRRLSAREILNFDYETIAFIESEVLREIERRRKSSSLGYSYILGVE